MVDPIPELRNVSEIGASESLSQASAIVPANDGQEPQEVPARFLKLRHYITQMQGMLLDTQA